MMDEERLNELEKLCNSARPGPWKWEALDGTMLALYSGDPENGILDCERCDTCVKRDRLCGWPDKANADFIAESRIAVLELIAALKEVKARLHGVTYQIQKHQPAGSPPPGDEEALAIWVLSELEKRAEQAEAEAAKYKEALEKALNEVADKSAKLLKVQSSTGFIACDRCGGRGYFIDRNGSYLGRCEDCDGTGSIFGEDSDG